MRKKRILAFLLSACLALTPVIGASASGAGGMGVDPDRGIATLSVTDGNGKGNGTASIGDNTITQDFESVTDSWGFSGGLANAIKIGDKNGNKYLQIEGSGLATQTATKTLDGVPEALGSAEVSYTFINDGLSSDGGSARAGLSLMNGPVEVVSVYIADGRASGNYSKDTPVYYSVQGVDAPQKFYTAAKAPTTFEVSIKIDFAAHTAAISIDGEEKQTVTLNPAATSITELKLNMAGGNGTGKTYAPNIGFDNFSMTYDETGAVKPAPYIQELASLEAREATKADYEKNFVGIHPASVEATLSDGTTKELQIDAASWTADKAIVADDIGTYAWTADVVLPDDNSVTNTLNLKASYTMKYMSDFLGTDIDYLVMPASQTAAKEQFKDGVYQLHPKSVAAKLVNGGAIQVEIDQTTWACADFDLEKRGAYTWTADIIAPEGNRNHRNLKVSYTMYYMGNYVKTHDYENDFTLGQIDWGSWGKEVAGSSHTGNYTFELKTDADGNAYLEGTQNDTKNATRGSRVDLPDDIVKGATVQFDWNPVSVPNGNTDISFVSPAIWENFFTILVDKNGSIKYFTEPNYPDVKDKQGGVPADCNGFEGEIKAANPADTGLTGMVGQWFTVKLDCDFIEHKVVFSITKKGETSPAYTSPEIPIFEMANGVRSMVMRKNPGATNVTSVNALDNIFVDYDKFDKNDIVSIQQPADINMTKDEWNDGYAHPAEVTAVLGNGSKVQIQIPAESWKSTPEFKEDTEGTYTWSAELPADQATGLIAGKYTNYFKLSAAYKMSYTLKPYVTRVNNPSTLELPFGQDWDGVMPDKVTVVLSSGEIIDDAPVVEWKEIRAFNGGSEGIYVYGAKLAEDERYVIKEGVAAEYHKAQDRANLKNLMTYNEALYNYDAFYRISYFKGADNYNGYTRSMENLNRGVTAVPAKNGGILVSWRLFADEYKEDMTFDILKGDTKINSEPISTKTNYLDASGTTGAQYTVKVYKNGELVDEGSATALAQNYFPVSVQQPDPQLDYDGNLNTYTLNDAGVADVDGDGEYEIVVKWYPSDAFDSGSPTFSAPTIFDFYEMDGTPLWRLNLGLEMPSGAHFNQFIFYDLDEDGKAEFFIKASDGTVSYKPDKDGKFVMTSEYEVSYVGDRSVVPGSGLASSGHAGPNSNEYVVAFKGATGELISQIDYANPTHDFFDWGEKDGKPDSGNRSARYNIALAYLPATTDPGCTETVPAVLLNRGYYDRTTVAAYILNKSGQLELRWNFVARKVSETKEGDPDYGLAGKGNHNVSTGDMDNDGFDELVIGAMAIDHDGSVLWVKDGKDGQDFQGHSDSIHLSAMNPEDPTQLYVFTPSEEVESTLNGTLSNAENGSRINGTFATPADIGRGVAANITPRPGFEYWINKPGNEAGADGAIYNFDGTVLVSVPPSKMSTNWRIYWDGDLLSELGDGRNSGTGNTDWKIYKYNWNTNELDDVETMWGTHTNNWTKNNPSLTADLFGDWREEVIVPSADNTELRIYMTPYETDYMIYSLMQDPVYRNAVANQNTAYNQPPHLGFYLGEDNKQVVLNKELTVPKIRYTTVTEEPTPTPTATPTATPEATAAPTATPEATTVPTATPGATTEPTAGPDATTVPTATPGATTEPTAGPDATTAPTATPGATTEPTAGPDATTAPTATPDATTEPTAGPDATAAPTAKPDATTKPDATAKPDDGGLKVETVKEGNAPDTKLSTSKEEVKKILETIGTLTAGYIEAINNGAQCDVSMTVKDISVNVPEKDKNAIAAKFPQYTAGQYVDISLSMVITKGNDKIAESQIHDLGNEQLEIQITIPDHLINKNAAFERVYRIIRAHEGEEPVELPTTLSSDGKMLSFKSSKFSTYLIAYTDKPIPVDQDEDDTDTSKTDVKTNSAKTGDSMNYVVIISVIALILAGAGVAIVLKRRKESR